MRCRAAGPVLTESLTMTTRPWFLLLPLLALALVGPGCGGSDPPEHQHDEGEGSGATCPPSGAPTAQDFGNAFMANYCTSCHSVNVKGAARGGAPENVNFDTAEDVRTWAMEIDEHAAAGPHGTNTEMPPAPLTAPTQAEREKLGQWLACGAP
jgi:hypothetical protein